MKTPIAGAAQHRQFFPEGRPAVVGDSILLPPKAGYASPPANTGPAAAGAEEAAAVEGGPAPDHAGFNPIGGLRVTALKVLRTRIKLLKVEPAAEPAPGADGAA